MASINKLSLRGIRSFSPDDQEQVVEFYYPLTVIHGANGCGKTTIIEALKYALSGSMPPGGTSRSAGQVFVHDPRVIDATTVKAVVKLRFTNKAGKSQVVIRTMELTKKKNTMTFKQLDGALRTVDPSTGERVTLSSKCSELDKQIPLLMGVKKAILDYVLFVHQEDSSWPLQEAAVLKKRFDEIFDTGRYSKALDSFKKTKKELAIKLKDIQADMNTYKSHRHAANEFKKELSQQNEQLEQLEDEIKESKDQAAAGRKVHDSWLEIATQVDNLNDLIQGKQNELSNLRSGVSKQRSMLEKDLTKDHDIAKLKEMLRDFDKEIKQQQDRQEELVAECISIQNEIEGLRQEEIKLNSSKGKYAAEKEAQEKRLSERVLIMTKMASTYALDLQSSLTQLTSTQLSAMDASMGMSQGTLLTPDEIEGTGASVKISKEEMDKFFRYLEKKEAELKENLRSHKAKFRAQEDEYNKVLQELVGSKNSFENERKKLNDENQAINQELKTLDETLGSNKIKKSSIDELRERAKEFAKELENLTKNDQRDQLGAAIRSHNERINAIDEEIETKLNMRKRYQRSQTMANKLNLLRENRSKDVSKLKALLQEKISVLKSFDIDPSADLDNEANIAPFVRATQNTISQKNIDAAKKVKEAKAVETKTQSLISQQTGTSNSLIQSRNSLQQRKEVLSQADRSVGKIKNLLPTLLENGYGVQGFAVEKDDPKELLDLLDGHLQKLEANSVEELPPDNVAKLVKRIKKLAKKGKSNDNRECPCCRRGLNEEEYRVFSDTIKVFSDPDVSPLIKGGNEEEVQAYRNELARTKKWREIVYESMHELLEYRRTIRECEEIAQKLQGGDAFLKQHKKELETNNAAVVESERVATALRELSNACKGWVSDASRIEEQTQNINDINEQLEIETADAVGGSLEEVEEQIQVLRDEKDELYNKITKSNKKVTAINQEITAASSKCSKTQENLRQKEEKFEKEKRASERKQTLETRKNAIVGEVTKLGEKITSLTQKVRAKEGEKSRLYNHSSDEESKLNETLNTFLSDVKHLRDLSIRIDEFSSNEDEGGLDRIIAEVDKLIAKINKKKKEYHALQPDLENVKKAVGDQERHRKVLRDNIDLLDSLSQIEEVEQKLLKHEEDKSKIEGADEVEQKMEEASFAINKHESIISRLEGRRSEMIDQIRLLKRKLGAEEYRNVDEEYRAEKINFETTQLAIKDLDCYAKALDKALVEFHGKKIAEINVIIRELWLMTYKGEDIKNIWIESTQDSRASKSSNYRVVMQKGGADMDMRGRCSAGQRVLASIVIRLALAETFGVACGCLVLDEPTVNLDEDNKRGLAVALGQLIANRSKQANFQLVLITHDSDFLSIMKDELSSRTGFSMPERYFHVRREESNDGKYYSKIEAIDWDELM